MQTILQVFPQFDKIEDYMNGLMPYICNPHPLHFRPRWQDPEVERARTVRPVSLVNEHAQELDLPWYIRLDTI
jgi:hypothetical protein